MSSIARSSGRDRAGFGGEAVVDPYGVDAAVPELIAGEVVDRDVTPGRILDRELGDVGEVGPLPGWIMVMHHRRSAGTDLADRLGGGQVERDGAEVLDDDQIGIGEGRSSSARSRGSQPTRVRLRSDRPDLTGDRHRVEAHRLDGALPVPGHNRHSVGETQSERHESADGHVVHHARSGERHHDRDDQVGGRTPDGRRLGRPRLHRTEHGGVPLVWLWDSCFHALIWADLDRPDRAVAELGCVLELQDGAGFVPHMGYQLRPAGAGRPLGRAGSSSITQPPMYGHAVAELRRRGIDVPDELAERAHAGLRFLVRDRLATRVGSDHRGAPMGDRLRRLALLGPLLPGRRLRSRRVASTQDRSAHVARVRSDGGPLANPAFGAASVSNALTVWNARELASVTGDDELLADVDALVPLIEDRWDADLATWVDAGPGSSTSGRIRTADPLCALLVADDTDQRAAAVASLADSADHGGALGPRRSPVRSRCTTRRPTGGGRSGPSWPTCSGEP